MVEFLRSEELNGEGETVTAFWTGYCGVLFGCKNIPEKGYFVLNILWNCAIFKLTGLKS